MHTHRRACAVLGTRTWRLAANSHFNALHLSPVKKHRMDPHCCLDWSLLVKVFVFESAPARPTPSPAPFYLLSTLKQAPSLLTTSTLPSLFLIWEQWHCDGFWLVFFWWWGEVYARKWARRGGFVIVTTCKFMRKNTQGDTGYVYPI